MDNKSSYLKLKLYIFSSADSEQLKDHQQLKFKDKKERSLTGHLIYAYGLVSGRKGYGRKI